MSEEIHISQGLAKEEKYRQLLPQMRALLHDEPDLVARMANFCAALMETFGFLWAGFYRADNDELILGPFQGPVACTRIAKGKGVCGTAWEKKATLVVPDVDRFPGHIACSGLSRSEIVVPVFDDKGDVALVLDVDADRPGAFDETDQIYLERMAGLLLINP